MNFFKRLFSSSNLELQINDGGRAAAGYKGKAGDCVVRSIAIVTGLPYQKIMMIFIRQMKNLELHHEQDLLEV